MCRRLLISLLAGGLLACSAGAGETVDDGLFVDGFDAAHDYLNDGVGDTGWDGFVGLEWTETANAIDASISREGQLYLESEFNSRYQEPWDPLGPFLYKIVEGNFRVTVRITEYAGTPEEIVYHNNCGLMARNVEDADAGAGEDWVSLDYFPIWGCGNFVRTADNGTREEVGHNSRQWQSYTYLRLVRRGNVFRFLVSPDGQAWEELEPYSPIERTDFDGLPVAVGVFQAVYSDAVGYAAFDDFVLEMGLRKAELVSPLEGADDVELPVILEWAPGDTAAYHDVYLGTDPDGLAYMGRQASADTIYLHLEPLENGQTYYWRIDEVEADETTINTGDVWSFTTKELLASRPQPEDGQAYVPTTQAQLSWRQGAGSMIHYLYLGTDKEAVANADKNSPEYIGRTVATVTSFPLDELEADTTYYWRVDEDDLRGNLYKGGVWSFTTLPEIPVQDPDLVGWWTFDESAGEAAVDWSGHGNHGVLVNGPTWSVLGADGGALVLDGQDDYVELPLGGVLTSLESATIATWVNFSQRGGLWQRIFDFGSGTSAYMFLCPRTGGGGPIRFAITNSGGANESLVEPGVYMPGGWHHVAVTIDSADRTARLYLDGVAVGSGVLDVLPSDLGETSQNWLGRSQYGADARLNGALDDFRIYQVALSAEQIQDMVMPGNPLRASSPTPVSESVSDVLGVTALRWQSGQGATGHDVYLGTDLTVVTEATPDDTTGVYVGRQSTTQYVPAEGFVPGQTYYWRIDEVGAGDVVTPGTVWTFTVVDYIIVDDFESYTGTEGDEVFYVWLDGYGCYQELGGSTSGHIEAPFIDTQIVHGGSKALPLYYQDDGRFYDACGDLHTAKHSKAMREFETPQNWVNPGGQDRAILSLWVRGQSDNAADPLFIEVEDSLGKTALLRYEESPNPVAGTSWTEWRIELADISAAGVNLGSVKKLTIGVGDPAGVQMGGMGILYVDDVHLYGRDGQ